MIVVMMIIIMVIGRLCIECRDNTHITAKNLLVLQSSHLLWMI